MGARRRFPKGDRKLRLFSCPLVASAEAIPLRSETALHGSRISHRHRTDSRKRARSPLSPGTAAPHCSFVLIAVRVRFLPAPRVAAHVFQRLGCRPAEQLLRLRRVGIAGIHIAVAARAEVGLHFSWAQPACCARRISVLRICACAVDNG